MISFGGKGDFSKTIRYFTKLKNAMQLEILEKYGRAGVAALSSATPVDSGKTASSWTYEVSRSQTGATITFYNSNVNKGVNIAIILQYGHGTGTGGWVEGRDYINPAIQPVFDKMVESVWKEVTSI